MVDTVYDTCDNFFPASSDDVVRSLCRLVSEIVWQRCGPIRAGFSETEAGTEPLLEDVLNVNKVLQNNTPKR